MRREEGEGTGADNEDGRRGGGGGGGGRERGLMRRKGRKVDG